MERSIMQMRVNVGMTMVLYNFVTRLDVNIVILNSDEYGEQIWVKCKTRKKFRCRQYDIEFEAGSVAYRPQTNGYNRMDRISEQAMLTMHK